MIRLFGNKFERKVMAFKAQMSGAIEPELKEDFVFGPEANRLIFKNLEELVLAPESEIVEHNAFGLNGKDLIKVVGFKNRTVSIGGVSGFN